MSNNFTLVVCFIYIQTTRRFICPYFLTDVFRSNKRNLMHLTTDSWRRWILAL